MKTLAKSMAIVSVVAVGLASGLALVVDAPSKTAHATPALLGGGGASIADVTELALPSVVNIKSTKVVRGGPAQFDPFFSNPFSPGFGGQGDGGEQYGQSLGSGVIISASGRVVTNNHVVADSKDIRVVLSDGRELDAQVVGTDPKSDVAVLQLTGKFGKVTPIRIGNSEKLRLGDVVLAIGNPFGVGQAVTMGIVSAKGRANMGITEYEDFIQTDAAINPGNSGGALINMRGELVGINTAILSKSGGYQGIGFAIPSDMLQPIVSALVANGKVSRGWMGIAIQSVDRDLAAKHNLGVAHGVLVTDVMNGAPAASAGLVAGDVILAVNGTETPTAGNLRNLVSMAGAGNKVRIDYLRGKDKKTAEMKLEAMPDRGR